MLPSLGSLEERIASGQFKKNNLYYKQHNNWQENRNEAMEWGIWSETVPVKIPIFCHY